MRCAGRNMLCPLLLKFCLCVLMWHYPLSYQLDMAIHVHLIILYALSSWTDQLLWFLYNAAAYSDLSLMLPTYPAAPYILHAISSIHGNLILSLNVCVILPSFASAADLINIFSIPLYKLLVTMDNIQNRLLQKVIWELLSG